MTKLFLSFVLCSTLASGAPVREPQEAGLRVLSAFFGDVILPDAIDRQVCTGDTAAGGLGGMPFVLNRPVEVGEGYRGTPWALDPTAFRVAVGPEGRIVTPVCATLQPAIDPTEQKTILLAGSFGLGPDEMPVRIEVVGDVRTTDGGSLRGLEIGSIEPPNAGSNLVYAEVYDPDGGTISMSGPGDTAYCPRGQTFAIAKLTFSGGVRGPNGATLTDDANAMAGIWVLGVDSQGRRVALNPFALRDADNDNYLDACFGAAAQALALLRVSVNSHLFYSPMNAPNAAAAVEISAP